MNTGLAKIKSPGQLGVVLEEVPCPLCEKFSEKIAAKQHDIFHRVDPTPRWTLRSCESCRHYFISPRPEANSMGKFYPQEYPYFNPSKLKTFIRNTLRFVVSHAYIPNHQSKDFHYYPKKNFLLQFLAKLMLPALSNRGLSAVASPFMTEKTFGLKWLPGMKFLEIGCGAGWDVHLTDSSLSIRKLVRKDVICVAVEPSPEARRQLAQDGIRSFPNISDAIKNGEAFYDIIRLNWSLEHVDDPCAMLNSLRKLCRRETKIIITVPNYDATIYAMAPDCIEVPVHLQYFTPASMRKLLSITGFKVQRLHTFTTPSQIALIIGYLDNKNPEKVLTAERQRILALMGEACEKERGADLFCLLTPA